MFSVKFGNQDIGETFSTEGDAQEYADYLNGSYLGEPWKVVKNAD